MTESTINAKGQTTIPADIRQSIGGTPGSYDQWFRSKVEASLRLADDPNTPRYSTDEVARRMAQVIKVAETKHASRRLA